MFKHLLTTMALLFPVAGLSDPLTTAFTYQGQLTDGGTPPTAAYDFEFCLFGSLAGPDLVSCHAPLETVPVSAGLFSVRLDFGPGAFIGDEQFLEIRVRPDASVAAFTPLVPRQAITAAPNALHALSVAVGSVGTEQIAFSSIQSNDIAVGAVNTNALGLNSVTSNRIVDGAVAAVDIANDAVTLAKLAGNSVDSTKIVDLGIGSDDLATASVTATKLANGAVGLTQINSAQVQARVGGSCGVGEYLRGVNADGTVVCDSLPGVHRVTVVEDVPGLISGTEVSIAIGTDGLPIVAYRESAQGSLRVAKCGNTTCSANNVLTEIEAAGDTGKEPNIVIGSDGLPAIAYVNQNVDVRYVHCGNAACSSGNTNVLIEGSANTLGSGMSMAVGSDGFPIMSYGDRTAQSLKFARCTTVLCSAGSVSVIELDNPANDVGIITAMMVASNGFPFIVYRDFTDNSIDVVRCGSLDCLTSNILTPDISPAGGLKVELAVVNQPSPLFPLVAWRNPTGSGMFLLECGSFNCATGNVLTAVPHPAGNNMQSLNLSLGAGGLPVISYHDAGSSSLGLLRCGDRSCGVGNSFTTVDDAPSVSGLPNAMAQGTDGAPVIAYAHSTDGALRVVKCASPSCQ